MRQNPNEVTHSIRLSMNRAVNWQFSNMSEPCCTCCYPSQPSNIHHKDFSVKKSKTNNEQLNKTSSRRSKHIPHHLRPAHLVERRNTRERRRVQDVNQAFYTLQALLPVENNGGHPTSTSSSSSIRLSKVRTLRKAIDYIIALQEMLDNC